MSEDEAPVEEGEVDPDAEVADEAAAAEIPVAEPEPEPVILKKSTIKRGLSQVERTSDGKNFGFVALNLQGQKLITLAGELALYSELKYLNVSSNELTGGLSDLTSLSNLVSINAQKNQLSQFGSLTGNTQLQLLEVDDNQIDKMSDFYHPSLRILTASRNLITMFASSSGDRLNEGLEVLDVSNNAVISLLGIDVFPNLKVLNISGNQLTSLDGIEKLEKLERLDISNNQIPNVKALQTLAKLPNLKILVALENKAVYEAFPPEGDEMLMEVLSMLPNLKAFDQRIITLHERAAAETIKQDKRAEQSAKLVQEENERKIAADEAEAKAKEEREAKEAADKEAAAAAAAAVADAPADE